MQSRIPGKGSRLLCALAALACTVAWAQPAASSGVFPSDSYPASMTFQDALGSTTVSLTFDGTNFWSSSGGSASGTRYAQYTAAGAVISTYAPGLDFRSVFTNANAGPVYARQYANPTIYVQTSPGVFTPQLSLTGGTLDDQSSVVFAAGGTELVAMSQGIVTRWEAATGNVLGTVMLNGYGSQSGETDYPQNRGVAIAGTNYLTYSQGVLSAWDAAGNRVGQTTLTSAGQTFTAHVSLSYAAGKVWIIDDSGGTWRGYDVGLVGPACGRVAVLGAPNAQAWNDDVQAKVLGAGNFSAVDAFYLPSGVPTLAQLGSYDAVLVYTDGGISANTSATLGDRLADYVDAGGGVVMAVFATASIPITGRFNSGDYWAIEPSSQLDNSQQGLGTVFAPGHPILSGVSSFDGGSGSYRPSGSTLHAGALRVADWSGPGSIPLIATRAIGAVRRADLGFYPPSSDARSDFWSSSTDGDLIMANALAHVCGKPTIVAVCGNGVVEPGEQCDDGNTADGDCCSSSCQFESAGSSCPDDGNACTSESCDGAGVCQHLALPDSDGDSVCDAVDTCTNVGGARDFYPAKPKPRLVISKVNADTVAGNDGLKVSAAFNLPAANSFAALDPSVRGARVVLLDQFGGVVADHVLPGGSYAGNGTRGWKANTKRTSWQYLDKTGSPVAGFTGVRLSDHSKSAPGQVWVSVTAKNGSFPVGSAALPAKVVFVPGDQTDAVAGRCGESDFTPANCKFNGKQTVAICTE